MSLGSIEQRNKVFPLFTYFTITVSEAAYFYFSNTISDDFLKILFSGDINFCGLKQSND